MHWRRASIAALAVWVLAGRVGAAEEPAAGAAPAAPSGTLAPTTIKDLYYGDVLFYFYQDDYFNALTRLRAAQDKGRVSHHTDEAELLLGGLYLSYGEHLEAGKIFERLLARNVSPSVANRAWFYLGKVWYQRSYWSEAEGALRKVKGELPPRLEAEKRNLLAQVLIQQGRYDDAIAELQRLARAAGLDRVRSIQPGRRAGTQGTDERCRDDARWRRPDADQRRRAAGAA